MTFREIYKQHKKDGYKISRSALKKSLTYLALAGRIIVVPAKESRSCRKEYHLTGDGITITKQLTKKAA